MASDKDRKSGAANALNKFLEKDWREQQKLSGTLPKRKHKKPEKEVEKACVDWMRKQGWVVEIYESKATLSNGVWRQQSMKAGTADCMGVMPDGTAVIVEFKAPGKLKTFWAERNQRQQEFLIERINLFAFACVTDSVKRLIDIYDCWRKLNDTQGRNYLMEKLEKV
jgi:hypothetical protein